jgi:hypothetical protein
MNAMATVKSIEETLNKIVTETPRAPGLKLNIELVVYDNGMVSIAGRPITDQSGEGMVPGGSIEAWNAAHEIFAIMLRLFARRVRNRVTQEAA